MNDQATCSPANVYDQYFVPALFHHWGPVVADAAGVSTGQRVLDVACGTGALTVAVAERVGPEGAVVGLDPNDDMLSVARRKASAIDWQQGQAESLPFPDQSFDAVVSQFGFMFFEGPSTALREMMRVLKPGGRLAVAVCDALDHSPGYAVFTELLHRLFGEEVAQSFRAPFLCGDPDLLHSHCKDAGISDAKVARHEGKVHFDTVGALVSTERACAWTLGGVLDEAQFERLLPKAKESLQPFVTPDGTVAFDMPALIVTAQKL